MARVPRMASVHAWACQTSIDINIMNFLGGRETRLFTGKFNTRFDDRVNSNVKRKVGGVRSEPLERRTPGIQTGMKSVKCCLSQADCDLVCVCFSPNVNPKRRRYGPVPRLVTVPGTQVEGSEP